MPIEERGENIRFPCDLDKLQHQVTDKLHLIDRENFDVDITPTAVWFPNERVMSIVFHVHYNGEWAYVGYDVDIHDELVRDKENVESLIASTMVWEYLAGDNMRSNVLNSRPGEIYWPFRFEGLFHPDTIEDVGRLGKTWLPS